MIVAMSDRHRPPAGLRGLAEQQVTLLKDKYEDFQQVWHHFCNSKKRKSLTARDSLIQIEGRCSQFLSLFTWVVWLFICIFYLSLIFHACNTSSPTVKYSNHLIRTVNCIEIFIKKCRFHDAKNQTMLWITLLRRIAPTIGKSFGARFEQELGDFMLLLVCNTWMRFKTSSDSQIW